MKKITLLLLFLLVLAWEGMGQQDPRKMGTCYGTSFYVDAENYRRAGKYDLALKEINKAINNIPGNFTYYYSKALILFQMKDLDASLQTLNKILKLKFDYMPTYSLKSKIFELNNQLDSAVNMIEKAIELAPDDINLIETAGKLLCKANKLNDGIVYLEMVVAQNPKNYECYNILSIAHKRNGNMDKALEYRSLYLKTMPKKRPLPAGS